MSIDVIVVGAGVAGAAAANHLRQQGRSVLVVESRARTGGRVSTIRTSRGDVAELGAQVVHGANNPALLELRRTRGESAYELMEGAEMLSMVRTPDGVLHPLDARGDFVAPHISQSRLAALQRRFGPGLASVPVEGALRMLRQGSHSDEALVSWVEQVSGQDVSTLPVPDLLGEEHLAPPPGDKHVVSVGMAAIVDGLLAGTEVRLGLHVQEVRATGAGVTVETSAGAIECRQVILTIPPAAVAAGAVSLPQLPAEQRDAAATLVACPATVAVVEAGQPCRSNGFVHDTELGFLTWHEGQQHTTLVAKGRAARAVDDLDDGSLAARLDEILHSAAGHRVDADLPVHRHGWTADPLSAGGLTLGGPAAAAAAELWSRPVLDRIHPAGEATLAGSGHPYVDRAHASGVRAAEAVLARLDDHRPTHSHIEEFA